MKKYFVLSLVAVALTGCGTVFTGTTKTVNMNMSGQNMNNKTLLVNGRQYPMTNGYANVKLNKSCNDVPVYLKDDKSGKLDVLPSIETAYFEGKGSQNYSIPIFDYGDNFCLEIPFIILTQEGMYRTDRIVVIKK